MTNKQRNLTLLLDCDNTLVQSEHLAFAGCATLLTSVLASHNIPLTFDGPSLQQRFVGQNFRGMLSSLISEYALPISPAEVEQLVKAEEDAVIAQLESSLEPCEGVHEALDAVIKQRPGPGTQLAVVSSSALRRVNVSLRKTALDAYFGDRVYSAATSLPTPTSKPDPAVYLFAMAALEVSLPTLSVAVEDSVSGTLSATRAGIPTVGYVGAEEVERREEMAGKLREAGAKVVMRHWSEFGDCLAQLGW